MQGDSNRRHVVSGGETVAHELPRVEASLPGQTSLCHTEEEMAISCIDSLHAI